MSVLVLQYNASVIEVQKTIQSILRQQNIEFEIVVADDGSKENHFTQLEDYFKARGFNHYSLVNNPHNGGTVKNILSGLKMCNGKYVKCISPGDYLYDEMVLWNVYSKMEKNQAGLLFGRMAFYQENRNQISILKEQRPFRPEIYETGNNLKIRKHLLIYQDNIPGAAAFVKTELFRKMMALADNRIVYQEDLKFSMPTFMDETIIYQNNYVVWYEYGQGVSTNGADKWVARLQKDTLAYYHILQEVYPKGKYVKRALLFQKLEMKQGFSWKLLKTALFLDRFLFRRNIGQIKDGYKEPDIKLLEEIIDESGR